MDVSGGEDDDAEEQIAELDCSRPEPAAGRAFSAGHGKVVSKEYAHRRVIVHLDLDCFYAQVEMICNPELRNKPLGVQQKHIMVTCNYEARKLGVNKCMSLKDAKEKCPQLVFVNGEDLTKYREMSYKVTALLEEFAPLVERLGFDENFVDVTEMVDMRLEQWEKNAGSKISFSGHVYNNQTVNLHNPMHVRLAVGSQIAAELREAMHNRLGLTGCAGIASNKLLAKLVSGTFKPNQQTTLLPESRQDLMTSLDHVVKVPGIGYRTAKRLVALGVITVGDLQKSSAAMLEKELGVSVAQHIQQLSRGEDDSLVTLSGLPQSLSDEDSFRRCSSEAEVRKKVEELLSSLLDRLHKDGRKPHTIRLTIRQFSTQRWSNRESRQCPLPSHLVQRIGTGDSSVMIHLVAILMKLFRKMIHVDAPFHLTLLSVCFSNLKAPPTSAKQSIGYYLTCTSTSGKPVHKTEDANNTESTFSEGRTDHSEAFSRSNGRLKENTSTETMPDLPKQTGIAECPLLLLPDSIDLDVFHQLPRDIREEIILSQRVERNTSVTVPLCAGREELSDSTQHQTSHTGDTRQDIPSSNAVPSPGVYSCPPKCLVPQHSPLPATRNAPLTDCSGSVDFKSPVPAPAHPPFPKGQGTQTGGQKQHDVTTSQNGSCKDGSRFALLPPEIDLKTFHELPTEVQKELLAEWKSREAVSKMCPGKGPEKPRGKKKDSLPSSLQSNSLLRYFKRN